MAMMHDKTLAIRPLQEPQRTADFPVGDRAPVRKPALHRGFEGFGVPPLGGLGSEGELLVRHDVLTAPLPAG